MNWAILTLTLTALGPSGDDDFFESRVRPVLVEHCLKCHGDKKQEMGLRLDSGTALARGSEAGPVIVPGDPSGSVMIEAIRHEGTTKMPPDGKLSPQAIADIETWVKQGAKWPETEAVASSAPSAGPSAHWAFQPIVEPPLPAVDDAAWCEAPIDRFIQSRLEAAKLTHAPKADRRTLIRRVTFDLLGLPPSPDEVRGFVEDAADDSIAYGRLVDRLLSSPHYGERWGRLWLDVARYASNKGYVFFEEPNFPWAYTYRDYVIRAFNENLPYNQFVVEQIAADRVVSTGDQRALAALGFLTVGPRFLNNTHDVLDDRIDVVTRGLMGLTVSCARCHDHKFDPISQKDYYGLYGVFANSIEPTVPPVVEMPPDTELLRAFQTELAAREAKLAEFLTAKHSELVATAKTRTDEYLLLELEYRGQPSTEDFMQIVDASDLNPPILARWRGYLEQERRKPGGVFGAWLALEAIPPDHFEQGARTALDGLRKDPNRPINTLIDQALSARALTSLKDVAKVYRDTLHANEMIVEDFVRRAALEGRGEPIHPDPARVELWHVYHGASAPPDVPLNPEGDLALVPDRASQATFKQLRSAVETWRDTGAGAPPRAMALVDSATPADTRVFLRGNPNRLGVVAQRGFPRQIPGPESARFHDGSGRLELARAITDPKNPLTARVIVNRVWMHHFGSPLVTTPSDFGTRSEPPSHPELLDWLAARFVADGWSIKTLHRQIVLSAAYQQQSADNPANVAIDPENRFYWHMNRRRLDFESMRDALLSVSGARDQRLYGPAIASLVDPATPRRTLYGFIDRLNLPGLFRTFDFPDPTSSSARREQTTVPPQALFLMNHPLLGWLADSLLKRPEIVACSTDAARIEALHQVCFGRTASAEDQRLAAEFLASSGDRAAAWKALAQAYLISNEFVFVD